MKVLATTWILIVAVIVAVLSLWMIFNEVAPLFPCILMLSGSGILFILGVMLINE